LLLKRLVELLYIISFMQIKVLICLVVLVVLGLCQTNQTSSQNNSKVLGGITFKAASNATDTMIEAKNSV
jgi:hypothetical protein